MNILVVSSYLPHPLHSGGDIRLYNLLKRLGKKHAITLVCEMRPFQSELDVKEIEKLCDAVITVPRRTQWSITNILASIFSSHSFLITGHTLPEMTKLLTHILKEKPYDVIHVETSYVYQNLPATTLPVVLTEHNIEYSVYTKYAQTKPIGIRQLLMTDVLKLKREEESFWKKAESVVVVSEQEKKTVATIAPHVTVIPNGVDLTSFTQKDLEKTPTKKDKKILFIGNYNWIQNQHSLRLILDDIWPVIEAKTDASVKLWVVGRNLPDTLKKRETNRIIMDGLSERTAPEIFKEAYVLLSPLQVAGGTQYKILESLSVGTPVVTTPLGITGFTDDIENIVRTGTTNDELAENVLELLSDHEAYKKESQISSEYIAKHYSFDAIAEKLDSVYHQVVRSKKND